MHICCAKSKATTAATTITCAIRSVYRVNACDSGKGSVALIPLLIAQLPLIATVVFYLQQQFISGKYVELYIVHLLFIEFFIFFLLYNNNIFFFWTQMHCAICRAPCVSIFRGVWNDFWSKKCLSINRFMRPHNICKNRFENNLCSCEICMNAFNW